MHPFSGIEKLRFKPAYNPYTEPSMEIFSYHEGGWFVVVVIFGVVVVDVFIFLWCRQLRYSMSLFVMSVFLGADDSHYNLRPTHSGPVLPFIWMRSIIQHSVVFHTETSHLIFGANQRTGFNIQCNTCCTILENIKRNGNIGRK